MQLIDRYRGALFGLACGDALGTTLEFKHPGTFEPVTDIVGGGLFDLQPGQWTDDTSMALCLGRSLIQKQEFDPRDQMQRYVRWRDEGYLSSTGACFDIGNTISESLHRFEVSGDPMAGHRDPRYGGNGSLMRLAPLVLAYQSDPSMAIYLAGEMSKTTHAAPEPVDACRYYTGLIIGALQGEEKAALLSPAHCPIKGYWSDVRLTDRIQSVAQGSFKDKSPPAIRGNGYVVNSLEAALWAFHNSDSFEEGALLAVNLGDDADTTGAIYGQLAGAYYGIDGIPVRWVDIIDQPIRFYSLADALLQFSSQLAEQTQWSMA